MATTTRSGLGSGIIISKSGQILTASHVIHDANYLAVQMADGTIHEARVVASIVSADLALIELVAPPADLPVVKLGDSDKVKIGEEVFVVSAPYGLEHTLTTGNLSGRRFQKDELLSRELEFLQTDAAINKGNSGGPLFNTKGEVIGIVSHIQSQSGGNEGLGFAASINMAKQMILNKPGYWWGMRYIPLDREALLTLNVPNFLEGLLVQHVARGSIAANLGIKAGVIPITLGEENILIGGDILVQLGKQDLYQTPKGIQRIRSYLESLEPGDVIEATVYREGQLKTLTTVKP